jgi:hypothetical protein
MIFTGLQADLQFIATAASLERYKPFLDDPTDKGKY